jgi:transposase
LRVGSGSSDGFVDRLAEIDLPEPLRSEIAPLMALMEPLRDQIQGCDARAKEHAKEDEVVRRLCTAPGIGPVTAATFVATLDTVERFERAHQVEAYLGLVPREMSSGEKQHKGRITKAGNSRARSLLIESAWCILRWKKPETEELRTWAERIARRRGKSKAAVALARRLAGILYAMWRDGTEYTAQRAAVQTEESLVTT